MPTLYDDGVLRITGVPPVAALAGEIDESSYAGLVSALDELGNGYSEVHMDLAGVRYCDLAGLRAIVSLTAASRTGAARRVVLHEVPPSLRKVLQIVGWDATPGLALDEPGGRSEHRDEQGKRGEPEAP
jgi:ABC-type transporter Mla MlaB component